MPRRSASSGSSTTRELDVEPHRRSILERVRRPCRKPRVVRVAGARQRNERTAHRRDERSRVGAGRPGRLVEVVEEEGHVGAVAHRGSRPVGSALPHPNTYMCTGSPPPASFASASRTCGMRIARSVRDHDRRRGRRRRRVTRPGTAPRTAFDVVARAWCRARVISPSRSRVHSSGSPARNAIISSLVHPITTATSSCGTGANGRDGMRRAGWARARG